MNAWVSRASNHPIHVHQSIILPAPTGPGKSKTQSSAWGRSPQQQPSNMAPPSNHDDRTKEASKPVANQLTKKRKPKLKNMSIGDLIPSDTFQFSRSPSANANATATPVRKATGNNATDDSNSKTMPMDVDTASISVFSSDQFPSLPTSSSGSAKTPAKPPPQARQMTKAVVTKKKKADVSTMAPLSKKNKTHQQPDKDKKPLQSSLAAAFEPKPHVALSNTLVPPGFLASSSSGTRDNQGDEHALLRLYQKGQLVVQNKGRQRIKPRKKNFTSLKKKVLQERLKQWKEHQQSQHADQAASQAAVTRTTVCVYNFYEPEELQDDDEYEEILSNFREMASKVGAVRWIFIPRTIEDDVLGHATRSFVDFIDENDATAAATCWEGLVIGGERLKTVIRPGSSKFVEEQEWQRWCLSDKQSSSQETPGADPASTGSVPQPTVPAVVLENALTEDDLEDEDCLEESVNDLRAMAEKFGPVANIRVDRDQVPRVVVQFDTTDYAVVTLAVNEMCKEVIGGVKLVAYIDRVVSESVVSILLENVLTEDDLEDEDCLAESLNDVRELATQFAPVENVCVAQGRSLTVQVDFKVTDDNAVTKALEGFNAMQIGGSSVNASLLGSADGSSVLISTSIDTNLTKGDQKEDSGALFSGDKRIPERFVEAKRTPKIPNSGCPRKYATLVGDETVKPLLSEMLGELMRLQKRAAEDKNSKAKRRLVMGLREVARGIRAHKVKMVVMANNLDNYGVLDEKLKEILDLAHEADVPVFFEFSKRTLGKAIGKSIKIAVVGVQSAEGAHQNFKKLMGLAPSN